MSFPKLKLSYFDMAGRAEAARIAFFIGGIPFEDHRFARQDAAKFKDSWPYGVAPVLEVNGELLGESNAIARYAGRLAGLYPENNPSATVLMDEVMFAVDQFGEQFRTWWTAASEDEKKVQEARLLNEAIPQSFAFVESLLEKIKQHPTFSDSSRLFIHEIWVHSFLATFLRAGFLPFIPEDVADGYKHWQACVAKVNAHPRVQEYQAVQQLRAKEIKLVSYPFNGREEPIRLALEIGGVQVEEIRLDDRAAFAKRYPHVPNTQSFVLKVNGEAVSTEAFAALSYVGRLTGLYPVNDALAALRIDEVFGVVEAMYNALLPALTESDPAARQAIEEKLADGGISNHLGGLDRRLKKRGEQFATGAEVTVADLAVHGAIALLKNGTLAHVPSSLGDDFPTLLSIHERVATLAKHSTP